MRRNRLAVGGWWVVLAGVLASPVQAQDAAERGRVGSVQLLVWNRAGQAIDLDVRVDGQGIYAGRVPDGTVSTSMEVGRIVQREPGTYLVHVTDSTRKVTDSVSVQIEATQGQNVGVHLTPDGVAFVLTRGDVTRFTPPAAPHDAMTVLADVSSAVAGLLRSLEN